MTEDYLQLSWDVVQSLVDFEVEFNDSQCELLYDKLLQTMKLIQGHMDSPTLGMQADGFRQSCEAIFKEHYRLVKDAEAIIRGCGAQDMRLESAIKLANGIEVFAEAILKLDWCTAVFLDTVTLRTTSDRRVAEEIKQFRAADERRMEGVRSLLREHAHGVNESGDDSLYGTPEEQQDDTYYEPWDGDQSEREENHVEDMDYEPQDASHGYRSKVDTILQPEGANNVLSTFLASSLISVGTQIFKVLPYTWNWTFSGANNVKSTFEASSLNSVSTQIFKQRTLIAIRELNDKTSGQNSKLQVNILQCKHMVKTILDSMHKISTPCEESIYKELFHIVKKADLIVQECSDEALKLKSLLAQMDNVHAFIAVIVDWQWCTRLFRKDVKDCTSASIHAIFEQLKRQDLTKNKKSWDAHIAELEKQSMSTTGDSKTREQKVRLAEYLRRRVQNIMNAYNEPKGLPPCFVWAYDPEAKRGDFLGMGTFGSVSEYTWFGMDCVEKSFNPYNVSKKQERDFENEVGVMGRLNHPHVVQLICCRQDCGKRSIVMELITTNLEKHIGERKYPFTSQVAIDIMSQIASGMEYLQGKGVVHRDLKPNNILVRPNANAELLEDGYVEVKLADFGLAKTNVNISATTMHSQICGAPAWRAPEAFADHEGLQRPFSAKKADIYGFAIICSQILSNNLHPFGDPPLRLRERIISPTTGKAIFAFQ